MEAVAKRAASLAEGPQASPELARSLEQLSRQASDLADRLDSFSKNEAPQPNGPVDVTSVLRALASAREKEWESWGLAVKNRLEHRPAFTTGIAGQLEQVFLHLLMHAEQRAQTSDAKALTFGSRTEKGKASIEISYSVPASAASKSEENPLLTLGLKPGALGVCREVVESYGGEIRFFSWLGNARLEVDLPVQPEVVRPIAVLGRSLTLLLVEPDATARRSVLLALGDRGHRVVPAHAEEAAELAERATFDAVLWAVRTGGARWGDLRDKPGVPPLILMSDGYDRDLARSLEESGNFLLKRPWEEAELDRVLAEVAARSAESKAKRR